MHTTQRSLKKVMFITDIDSLMTLADSLESQNFPLTDLLSNENLSIFFCVVSNIAKNQGTLLGDNLTIKLLLWG